MEATFGLIMLGQEGNDPLFDKYDNSELLPVGTMRQTDLGENSALTSENAKQQTESDVATADNNNNVNYDSDDTVLLEKEITDVIGDGPILRDGLPVETASHDETQEITDQLADLTVKTHPRSSPSAKTNALPVETTDTPVSPNKGKVVISSYKL